MIKELFNKYNISLTDDQEEKLNLYLELLIRWNKRFNLTSITERDEVIRKHFLDSAIILKDDIDTLFSTAVESSLLDLGTGAGFPGMVLAILKPEWKITLADSNNKKISFLNEVISELDIKNTTTIHGRAEDLGRDQKHRQAYDLVTSRAVAELRLLLELCIPFVKTDGYFISYKGPGYNDELSAADNAMKELNCAVNNTIKLSIENNDRSILIFEKTDSIPDRYPRRSGIPAKRPL